MAAPPPWPAPPAWPASCPRTWPGGARAPASSTSPRSSTWSSRCRKTVLRPLLRHLPRRPRIQRPHRDPAADRPLGLPAARPGQPRRLPRALAHVHHHHRRRRRPVALATTGATSTPPGTRARWTAGCSPTSPRTARPTARSPWATTPGRHPLPLGAGQGVHPADNYHCSVMGPTDANRIFWKRAATTPRGRPGGPVLETGGARDLTYESGPETLFKAGISSSSTRGSAGRRTRSPSTSSSSRPRARPHRPLQRRDVDGHVVGRRHAGRDRRPGEPDAGQQLGNGLRGRLRQRRAARRVLHRVQVRLRRAPAAMPAAGAQFLATKLEALASNEELWNTRSSSSTTTRTTGSSTTSSRRPRTPPSTPRSSSPWPRRPAPPAAACPSGPGFRVPAFVISPWSVGGHIFSEVSDHTSGLRLIEAVAAAGRPVRRRAGYLPQRQPLAREDLQRLDRVAAPGRGAGGAVGQPVRPRHHRGQPGRADGGGPAAAAEAAGSGPADVVHAQPDVRPGPRARCLGDGGGDVQQQRAGVAPQGRDRHSAARRPAGR